jgi:hypothetical protein
MGYAASGRRCRRSFQMVAWPLTVTAFAEKGSRCYSIDSADAQNQFIVGNLVSRSWTEQNQRLTSTVANRFLGKSVRTSTGLASSIRGPGSHRSRISVPPVAGCIAGSNPFVGNATYRHLVTHRPHPTTCVPERSARPDSVLSRNNPPRGRGVLSPRRPAHPTVICHPSRLMSAKSFRTVER